MTVDERYVWPAGHRSAACVTVDVDAEAPYLWEVRDHMPDRLSQLEMRRFGPRQGLPRLLELFDRHAIRATFFVPGIVAETHAWILPELAARGHEVGLHGYFHELVPHSSDAEFEAALDASIALFERQTGVAPVGFRSPAWEMTPGMIAGLVARGLAYDSSLMGYDHPYEIGGITELPVQWLLDDAIHFRFLGHGRDAWPPAPPEAILSSWRDEWRMLHRWGEMFMLTLHPWISGRGQRVAMLDRLFAEIRGADGVWLARCDEVAAHHAASPNRGRAVAETALPPAIGPRRRGA